MSDSGSFQTTAPALGLRASGIPCASFQLSLFPTPADSPKVSPTGLLLGVGLPDVEPLGWGVQNPHSSGGISAVVIILLFVGCLPKVGLDCISAYLVVVSFLYLCIFSCRRSFQLVFGSFSWTVAL